MTTDDQQALGHWINGEHCTSAGGATFTVFNPSDDSPFSVVAEGSAVEMDLAVQAAHDAFQTYRHTSVNERERWLANAAAMLEERKAEFVDLLIDEAGSTISKAQFETGKAVSFIRAAIGMVRQVSGKTLPSDYPGRISLTWREPRGVVAVITPFNVPLIKASRLCANALATGSTVVMLPSEHTPVIALKFAELLSEAGFPDGAVNVVAGDGYTIGDSLVTHPLVRSVTFTGSTVVGKHIQQLCARDNKHVTLELGGKNPLVILNDATLSDAVQGAVRGMFMHQGQACISSSRIYVQKGIYPEFIKAYTGAVSKLGVGDLRDPRDDYWADYQRSAARTDQAAHQGCAGQRCEYRGRWRLGGQSLPPYGFNQCDRGHGMSRRRDFWSCGQRLSGRRFGMKVSSRPITLATD